MRKIFNKMLVCAVSVTLVAILFVGLSITKSVKADDRVVNLNYWTFTRRGVPDECFGGNEGRIDKVTMNGTDEVIDGWKTLSPDEEKKSASKISTGFNIDIANTGWECQWAYYPAYRINPWSVQAMMKDVAIVPGHIYTVSFKAHASKKKYAYVGFSCDDVATPYEGDSVEGDNQIIVIGTTDKTYTYTFTNWISASKFTTTLMLGAFGVQYGWEGEDISNIVTEPETGWNGTVSVSDFKITDKGLNPDFEKAVEDCDLDGYDDHTGNPVPWIGFDSTKGDSIPAEWDGHTIYGSKKAYEDAHKSNVTSNNPVEQNAATDSPQTITAKSKTVSKGTKSFNINAKTSGNGKLTYTSSNKKVITVNSAGKVTVKGYGKATITIKASATAQYNETYKKITITVVPKKVSLKNVSSPGKKRLSVSWKKDKSVTGYQVYFSTRKDFKRNTYKRTFMKSTTRMSIVGLKSKNTYYVRIRAYKKVGKKKYYGAWSKEISMRIK